MCNLNFSSDILQYENYDLSNIQTPLDADKFEQLLRESEFNSNETQFLVNGFRSGFDLNYQGPRNRQDRSKNIPFTVGNALEMWNKIMKEVKEKRYAGPYTDIPFEYYVQSPIGLVPKAGNKTRLIFHLSYEFSSENHGKLINHFILDDLCSVKYHDLDDAIKATLAAKETLKWQYGNETTRPVFYSKADGLSAFRQVPLSPRNWPLLILMAKDPEDNQWKFFVDKCLPFGASISCALYQRISDAIAHLVRYKCR